MPSPLGRLRRFLRAPRVIVAEISAIALSGILGASLPQQGSASLAEIERLRSSGAGRVAVDLLGLTAVFRSGWFLSLTLLATASLLVVLVDQLRRLAVLWGERPVEASFRGAPYRMEFERPARRRPTDPDEGVTTVRTSGRLGLAGSPLFHLGILLVVVGALVRMLLGVDAACDVVEGEVVAATSTAWTSQETGVLARPFTLDRPLRLDEVRPLYYRRGDLRDLSAALTAPSPWSPTPLTLAINRELPVPGGRLFLGSSFGPAVLSEWRTPAGPAREAVLLAPTAHGTYDGISRSPAGASVHWRAAVDLARGRPGAVEIRIMRGPALVASAVARPGEALTTPEGEVLVIAGVPFWTRLRASRDPGLPLLYAGFALVAGGATILFAVVKVDTCVVARPAGGKERVLVALRAHRLAPLYRERFERLVRAEGGPAT